MPVAGGRGDTGARNRRAAPAVLRPGGRHLAGACPLGENPLGKRLWDVGLEVNGGWEALRLRLQARRAIRDAVMYRAAADGRRRHCAGRAGPERNARDQSEEDFGDDFGCDFEQTNLVYEEDFGFYLEGDESEGLDPDDEVDSNEDDLRAEIADSFLAAAVMAATAAQWFIERQEREKPPDQLDFRPFTRS